MANIDYRELKPGQNIVITQRVRVGKRSWETKVKGVVRDVQTLVTGVTVERAKDDIVTIPTLHFVKENGELSSIAIDENTRIELSND